jgi:hypothetical protein
MRKPTSFKDGRLTLPDPLLPRSQQSSGTKCTSPGIPNRIDTNFNPDLTFFLGEAAVIRSDFVKQMLLDRMVTSSKEVRN